MTRKQKAPRREVRPFEVAPIDIGPRNGETITDAMIVQALSQTNGKITLAAATLKMSPILLRERVTSTPLLAEAWQTAKDMTVDVAEFQLEQLAARGDAQAIGMKLKAQVPCQDIFYDLYSGYVDRQVAAAARAEAA